MNRQFQKLEELKGLSVLDSKRAKMVVGGSYDQDTSDYDDQSTMEDTSTTDDHSESRDTSERRDS